MEIFGKKEKERKEGRKKGRKKEKEKKERKRERETKQVQPMYITKIVGIKGKSSTEQYQINIHSPFPQHSCP